MKTREKTKLQTDLANARVALKVSRDAVKVLAVQVLAERQANKQARKDNAAAKKAATLAKRAERAKTAAAKKAATLAKVNARIARAQAALAKLNTPKALKRKARKASPVVTLVKDGKKVAA